MVIEDLKLQIENKNLSDTFLIFKLKGITSEIIINQYIDLISDILNLDINFIDSINDIGDNSFIEDTNLYVLKTDEWKETSYKHDNCIIICNKTKDERAILIPELEDWQIVDFCLSFLPGIEQEKLSTIIKKYNKNYFRFLNDFKLLACFNKSEQNIVFDLLISEGYFNDITEYTIWDLSNAVIKKDRATIKSILNVINFTDIDPMGLSKVLYSNFKNIASIQMNPKITYSDLNISDKQFFVIKKYNCGFYTKDELIEILKLLTNIEQLFKFEGVPTNLLIDYILVNILEVK